MNETRRTISSAVSKTLKAEREGASEELMADLGRMTHSALLTEKQLNDAKVEDMLPQRKRLKWVECCSWVLSLIAGSAYSKFLFGALTLQPWAEMIRRSAGILSPPFTSTKSPTTTSSALMCFFSPSRTTRACCEMRQTLSRRARLTL